MSLISMMRNWKTLALMMVALTAIFNIVLIKEMPDNSGRTIRSVENSRPGQGNQVITIQKAEIVSRKLGAVDRQDSGKAPKRGLLKRWILRSKASPAADAKTTAISTSSSNEAAKEMISDGEVLDKSEAVEKYLSHPHLGGQSHEDKPSTDPSKSQSDAAASAKDAEGQEQQQQQKSQGIQGTSNAAQQEQATASKSAESSEIVQELKEALIERPARLESLSEEFEQRQDIIAAVAESNGTVAAADVASRLAAASAELPQQPVKAGNSQPQQELVSVASPQHKEQQDQQQLQTPQQLMDIAEKPRAPVDAGKISWHMPFGCTICYSNAGNSTCEYRHMHMML